jgi:hypothetical protein
MYAVPTAADLDGDGLTDLAIGRYDQSTYVYRNGGSLGVPAWTRQPAWDPPALTGTSHAAPALADLNTDGLVDIVIAAENDGNLAYQNSGSTTAPAWTRRAAWDTPHESSRGWAQVAFGDVNGDGLPDLFLGDSRGTISTYRNDGSTAGPTWTLVAGWDPPQSSSYATPALRNLDDDRDIDLVVGDQRGTIDVVRNSDLASTAPGEWLSPVCDAGADGSSWTKVQWSSRAVGSGTTLTVEIRSAETPGAVAAAPWVAATQGEQAAPQPGRYAQVRVAFATTVATSTPVLESISAKPVPGFNSATSVFVSRAKTSLAWTPPAGVSPAAYDLLRDGVLVGTTTDVAFDDRPDLSLLGTHLNYCIIARGATGSIVGVDYTTMRFAKKYWR